MRQAIITMRVGTWHEALVREAAEQNRSGLASIREAFADVARVSLTRELARRNNEYDR
jgi:hypothetical protein